VSIGVQGELDLALVEKNGGQDFRRRCSLRDGVEVSVEDANLDIFVGLATEAQSAPVVDDLHEERRSMKGQRRRHSR
jgi:hypothetical protein